MVAGTADRREFGVAARAHAVLLGEDSLERACRQIPDSDCTALPRNFLLNAANGACTKLAEQIASPGLVLAWLLALTGTLAGLGGVAALGLPGPETFRSQAVAA